MIITQQLISTSPKAYISFQKLLQTFLTYDWNLEVREYYTVLKKYEDNLNNLRCEHTILGNVDRCFGNGCNFRQYCLWVLQFRTARTHKCQGVVSLTFRELSNIFSRNLCVAEIALPMIISSWNFVRVPKAMLCAHVQSFSLKFSP